MFFPRHSLWDCTFHSAGSFIASIIIVRSVDLSKLRAVMEVIVKIRNVERVYLLRRMSIVLPRQDYNDDTLLQ